MAKTHLSQLTTTGDMADMFQFLADSARDADDPHYVANVLYNRAETCRRYPPDTAVVLVPPERVWVLRLLRLVTREGMRDGG